MLESSQIQPAAAKEATPSSDTIVVLPNDVKKGRKGIKSLYTNKGKSRFYAHSIA